MEKLCKYCGEKVEGKYSKYASGEFCSKKCARGFSTKAKRKEINEQVSKSLTGKITAVLIKKTCPTCEKNYYVKKSKKFQIYCSTDCVNSSDDYKFKLSIIHTKRCDTLDEKNRLKEIGRKGGFGNKGYTNNGIYYQSNFEKNVFEYLDSINMLFTPHKGLPNSSKISDLYLPHLDLWVELDGIDREKKKKWLGKDYEYWTNKLEIYKQLNLKYRIFKKFEDFKNHITH